MLKPINQRVLVKCPDIEEEVNERGYSTEIALASGRGIVKGTVIASDKDLQLKPGDTIYFPRYAANEINYQGELMFSLHVDDIEFIEDSSE